MKYLSERQNLRFSYVFSEKHIKYLNIKYKFQKRLVHDRKN